MYEAQVKQVVSSTKNMSFGDIQFNTGDIILFRYDLSFMINHAQYLLGVFNFFITGTMLSHIGMVIIIDGKPYIYRTEAEHPRYDYFTKSYTYDTVVLLPLEKFIMEYPGDIFYYKIKQSLDYETEVKQHMMKYNDIKPLGTAKWSKYFILSGINTFLKFDRGKHKRYLCTELIVEMLQDLGLFNKKLEPYKYNFKDIVRGLMCCSKYEDVILIINIYREYKKLETS